VRRQVFYFPCFVTEVISYSALTLLVDRQEEPKELCDESWSGYMSLSQVKMIMVELVPPSYHYFLLY